MLLQTVRAALRWLPTRLRSAWAALAFLSIAVMLFELLAAGAVYRMVDRAARGSIESSLLGLVAAVFLARSLLLWIVALLQSRVVSGSIASVFDRLLAGYLGAPFQFHLGRTTAERMQRLTAAIDTTYRLVMAAVPALAGELMVMIGLTALIVVIAPFRAAVVAAVLAAAGVMLLVVSRKSVGKWGREQYEASQESIHRLEETFAGMREIKSGQREQEFHAAVAKGERRFTNAMRRHLQALAMPRVMTEAAFGIVAVAVVLIVSGRQTLGILALFAYAGFRLIPSTNRVIYNVDHIRHGAHAVAELDAAMHEVASYELPHRSPRHFSFQHAIEVDDVSFAYGDTRALRNVSLTIRKGEWIAVTGENGSGKSTLLDIVAGLLQPTSGQVRIDGRPLGDWLATSPPIIGYVGQHPHTFDAAALSAGQLQQAALARVLHDSPEILLLDEPATALDADAESRLIDRLTALRGRVTILLVSHRKETLRHCDRRIVLDEGRVYELASSEATIARI